MRSGMNQDEFFFRMKKKPNLQSIIDNLENFSVDQLNNVDQPLWIREQLMKMKFGKDFKSKKVAAERAASLMQHANVLFDEQLEVRVWTSPTSWLQTFHVDSSKGFQVEIQTNDMFLILLNPVLVLWGQSAIRPDWNSFISNTTSKGKFSKKEYLGMISKSEIVDQGNTNSGFLNSYGVSFK